MEILIKGYDQIINAYDVLYHLSAATGVDYNIEVYNSHAFIDLDETYSKEELEKMFCCEVQIVIE